MRTVGFVIGCGAGRSEAFDSSRVRAAFWAAERPSCIGCSFGALRYAVAKALNADGVCGMEFMRRKLGNKYAVVASGVSVAGSELAVMRTLVKG